MWHIHWVQSKEPGWKAPDQVIAKGREDESKSQGRNDMGRRMRGAEEHRAEGRGGLGAGGGASGRRCSRSFFLIARSNAMLMLDHVDSYGD